MFGCKMRRKRGTVNSQFPPLPRVGNCPVSSPFLREPTSNGGRDINGDATTIFQHLFISAVIIIISCWNDNYKRTLNYHCHSSLPCSKKCTYFFYMYHCVSKTHIYHTYLVIQILHVTLLSWMKEHICTFSRNDWAKALLRHFFPALKV